MSNHDYSDRYAKACLAAEMFARIRYRDQDVWTVVAEAKYTTIFAAEEALMSSVAAKRSGLSINFYVKDFYRIVSFSCDEAWAIAEGLG